jgi:aspartate aminotransferase
MTGWRVGYAIGPKEIISAMDTHQSQFTSNVCSIAQYAATKAAEDAGEFPRKMREVFSKRLDYVCQVISETPGLSLSVKPKGAFYAFIRIDGLIGKGTAGLTIKSAADFATYLLEKFDLAVVPGEAFGDAGAIRISFALSDQQLEKGLKRLKMAAESLS